MMKMWFSTLLILINLSAFSLAQELELLSDDSVEAYLSSVRQLNTLDANYLQKKQVQILDRKIQSKGRFIYVKDRGLLWHLKSPFEIVTVIKPTEYYQLDENFNRMPDQTNSDQLAPILAQIFNIFSGDLEPLEKNFMIYGARNKQQWIIKLVPIDEITKTVIEDIVIHGNRFIQSVFINNQNGDNTSIFFSEIKENSQTVTENELIFFTK